MAIVTNYKIRHKVTGLYRMAGGWIPGRWNKTGKAWQNMGHLKNHINMVRDWRTGELPDECKNWEVVIVQVEESVAQKMEIAEIWQ